MKIGIISINIYTKWLNFACPLHSFAMQKFLEKNGYESQVIDYKASYYNNYNMRYPADYYDDRLEYRYRTFPANAAKRTEWFNTVKLTADLQESYSLLRRERASRYDKFQSFIDRNLKVSEKGYTSASIEFEDPGFDCYMCVTDVIWKSEPSLERAFFLASRSMDNKAKIAYSASRGSSYTNTQEQEDQFFDYLRDFDAISVREPSLKEHIDEKSDIESTVVLDPVMLHDSEFYSEFAQEPEEKGYMFLYHVVQSAEDTIEQAVKYARAHNLKIIESSDRPYPQGKLTEYEDIEHEWIYDMSVEQWLGYIKNAECVFTNSFHCCCFSIIFGTNFFAGSRNGDKVDTVLSTFGLEERRFDMDTDILGNEPGDIDFEAVHKRLAEKREESGRWLLDALERAKAVPSRDKDYESVRRNSKYIVRCNLGNPYQDLPFKERIAVAPEMKLNIDGINNGETILELTAPFLVGYRFRGWTLRCKIDNEFYAFMKGGGYASIDGIDESQMRLFKSRSAIPYIDANGVTAVVADAKWEKVVPDFYIICNSDLKAKALNVSYDENEGSLSQTQSGKYEFRFNKTAVNDGQAIVPENCFVPKGKDKEKRFMGWKLRFWFNNRWFWYVDKSNFAPVDNIPEEAKKRIRIFTPGEKLPVFPRGAISSVVFCAQWKSFDLSMAYHSGSLKADNAECLFNEQFGKLKTTEPGALEYKLNEKISNEGTHIFAENGFRVKDESREFLGWLLRVKHENVWKWYLEDGTLVNIGEYKKEEHGTRRTFAPREVIEGLNIPHGTTIIAVASWKVIKKEPAVEAAATEEAKPEEPVLAESKEQ